MNQERGMVKKTKSLYGDAVRWVDQKFQGKTFSQRYDDAGRLLARAGAIRDKLLYNAPKLDMKTRERLYAEYKNVIAELTADSEGAVQQMKKLRGEFLTSESAYQRENYDYQMKKIKERLDDFREYARWVPVDLKRREYQMADAAIAAALSPEIVPRKVPATKVNKELREVASDMKELKAKRDAAKSPDKKAALAKQINQLRAKRDMLRVKLEGEAPPMDFTKFASKEEEKAFFAETDKMLAEEAALAKKDVGMPKKKEHKMASKAGTEKFERERVKIGEKKEMLAALKEARALSKEMAARRKAGKSLAGVPRKRYEAFVKYVDLGGDPYNVPLKVLEAMAKTGKTKRMG